jgi:hypothetical protein
MMAVRLAALLSLGAQRPPATSIRSRLTALTAGFAPSSRIVPTLLRLAWPNILAGAGLDAAVASLPFVNRSVPEGTWS